MKHAVVVGGSRGIGRVIVRRFIKEGYRVTVLSRTTLLINPVPRKLRYEAVDLTDEASVVAGLTRSVKKWGRLNAIVFCQRYRGNGSSWDGEMKVSLSGTELVLGHCARAGLLLRGASVVVIGSLAGRLVVDEQGAGYHVVKAALEQMIRFYAVKLGPHGVRVNGVCPGVTVKPESASYYRKQGALTDLYSRMVPLQRMGRAEDVAGAVWLLTSPDAGFVTGQSLVVDGGLSLQAQDSLLHRMMTGLNQEVVT